MNIGDRVEMTEKAIAQGLQRMSDVLTGTIVGRSNDPECIRVQRDGYKSVSRWHKSFWRLVETRIEVAAKSKEKQPV